MTTKTYFMKSFNIIIWLLALTLTSSFFTWLFNFIAYSFSTITSFQFTKIVTIANQTGFVCSMMAIGTLITALVLSGIEIVNRLKEDAIWNYVKSVYYTFYLRHFLFQREKIQKVTDLEHKTTSTINPVNNGFNRAVRKCVVDIHKDSITIFIQVPSDQQGQKILKEMDAQLKEEIASQHTEYYFSSPTRVRNQLWFTGKKR